MIPCRAIATTLFLFMAMEPAHAGCGLFTVPSAEVEQRSAKVFLDWDAATATGSMTVQVTYDSDTRDVGIVIPTPGKPKLEKMPPGFFAWLDLYTRRAPAPRAVESPLDLKTKFKQYARMREPPKKPTPTPVPPVEVGKVGHLAYKVFPPEKSAELLAWLGENKYAFDPAADELRTYLDNKWWFTVMKVDATALEPDAAGTIRAEINPIRLTYPCENLIYPLKIARVNVARDLDLTLYVQAPEPVDLPDEPPVRLDWAKRLDEKDQQMLQDPVTRYGDVKNPAGAREVTLDSVKSAFWASHEKNVGKEMPPQESRKAMLAPLDETNSATGGKIVQFPGSQDINFTYFYLPRRNATVEELEGLAKLKGILQPGKFLTRFSKRYDPGEMVKDPEIVPVTEEASHELVRDPPVAAP